MQKLLQGALPADTLDLNLTRLSGAEVTLDALRFASEAAPFLADRRAVVVEHAFARAARPARGGAKQREGRGSGAEGRRAGADSNHRVPAPGALQYPAHLRGAGGTALRRGPGEGA